MIPRVFHWAELAPFDPFVVSLSWQSKSLFFLQPKSLFIFFFFAAAKCDVLVTTLGAIM